MAMGSRPGHTHRSIRKNALTRCYASCCRRCRRCLLQHNLFYIIFSTNLNTVVIWENVTGSRKHKRRMSMSIFIWKLWMNGQMGKQRSNKCSRTFFEWIESSSFLRIKKNGEMNIQRIESWKRVGVESNLDFSMNDACAFGWRVTILSTIKFAEYAAHSWFQSKFKWNSYTSRTDGQRSHSSFQCISGKNSGSKFSVAWKMNHSHSDKECQQKPKIAEQKTK